MLSSNDDVPNLLDDRIRLTVGVAVAKRNSCSSHVLSSLSFVGLLLCTMHAWGSSGVVSAIEKKYLVTEVTADHTQITKDGTTMALKCAGVYSLPTNQFISKTPDNSVMDGKISPPNRMMKFSYDAAGAHVLQTGDKVYITKIEDKTDSKGDVLKFSLLTTDDLDVKGQEEKKKFSASVSFRFKKGYLDETPPDDVEQAIEAVLAPDSGGDQAQSSGGADPKPQQPAPPQPKPAPAPVVAAVPAAGPPPTISIGESSTQVLQAMGMPQQMIDLGKKKTFVYKNMKVIFVDDKVSDVQ